MTDIKLFEDKIKRLKRTLSEKSKGGDEKSSLLELRGMRKQLKRLQRRRRLMAGDAVSKAEVEAPGGHKPADKKKPVEEAKPVEGEKPVEGAKTEESAA